MKRDINDLIKEGVLKDLNISSLDCSFARLTSLNGIEKLTNLKELVCESNSLISLDGIEKLNQLSIIHCARNILESLKGIEHIYTLKYLDCSGNRLINLNEVLNLKNLKRIYFKNNPCYSKYKGLLNVKHLQEKIWVEVHLSKDSDLRGKASLIDSGLFDFKIK